jgi:thymidylate synthase
MLNEQKINARDLDDAWFQTLFKILEEGSVFTIDRGSYEGQKRLEFDWIEVKIKHPDTRPLLPKIASHYNIPDPVAEDYLDDYISYLLTGEVQDGESYTYGQRMCRFPLDFTYLNISNPDAIFLEERNELRDEGIIFYDPEFKRECINQIELLIWTYKNKGYRNNQMVLQVGCSGDMMLKDPPCLRHIDTRIQDGKLHFYPYFRSWDLYSGFPANLGGIQLLKEYIGSAIGVDDGEIIATSKGLHIYDYAFDIAKCLRMKEDMQLKQGDLK